MTEPSPAPAFPGNIEAAFVRLEGKIDRIVDKMDHHAEETIRIRDKLHEHANELAPLVLLKIPEKLATFETRIGSLEADREQRKGAMMVMRAVWAIIGFFGAGAVFTIVRILGGGL